MRLVCVYYIVYSLIRLKKATDANCPNKHFVSPHSWPDCHHSFQPQAPSLLSVKHVTFTGVDYTGEGQPETWISPFPYCSDSLLQIQPNAPPESQVYMQLQFPTTAPFSFPLHSWEKREEFISRFAATTYITAFMLVHLLLGLYSKQPQFFQPFFIGYVLKLSHHCSWVDSSWSTFPLKHGASAWIQYSSWGLQHRGVTFLALWWSALPLYFVSHFTKTEQCYPLPRGKQAFSVSEMTISSQKAEGRSPQLHLN